MTYNLCDFGFARVMSNQTTVAAGIMIATTVMLGSNNDSNSTSNDNAHSNDHTSNDSANVNNIHIYI